MHVWYADTLKAGKQTPNLGQVFYLEKLLRKGGKQIS